jgi:hypothetical protein
VRVIILADYQADRFAIPCYCANRRTARGLIAKVEGLGPGPERIGPIGLTEWIGPGRRFFIALLRVSLGPAVAGRVNPGPVGALGLAIPGGYPAPSCKPC